MKQTFIYVYSFLLTNFFLTFINSECLNRNIIILTSMSTLNLKNRQITALLFCVKFVLQTNFAWDLWPLTGKTTVMTMFYTCYQNHRSFKNIKTIWCTICRIGPSSFKQIKYTLKLINIKLTEWNFKEHYSTRNLVFWYLKQLINHFLI